MGSEATNRVDTRLPELSLFEKMFGNVGILHDFCF